MENREYRKVIEYVKGEIQQGRLNMEDKLPTERALAEELNMSRSSIREALRTMENMGMIDSRQGSGNYLTGNLDKMFTESIGMMLLLKQISYGEVNVVRRAIETEAYMLAIKNISVAQTEQLKRILETMKRADTRELVQKDKEFHYLIINASENKLIISVMEAMETIYSDSVKHTLQTASNKIKERLVLVHEKMLECIIIKDETNGKIALNEHYNIIESWYKNT